MVSARWPRSKETEQCHIMTYIPRGSGTTGQAFDAQKTRTPDYPWAGRGLGERLVECSAPYKATGWLPYLEEHWHRSIRRTSVRVKNRAKSTNSNDNPHRWTHACVRWTYARPRRSRICPTWECSRQVQRQEHDSARQLCQKVISVLSHIQRKPRVLKSDMSPGAESASDKECV